MRLTTNSMQRIAEDLRIADRHAADMERRGDLADVRVDGDQVPGEVGVGVAGGALVYLGRLVQRRAHAPDLAAHQPD